MEKQFYCCRFYVTHDCLSRCRFCDSHDAIYRSISPLPLAQAKDIIRQFADVGVQYIDFTGGEPMLNPNLPQLIQYAKSLGIKTEVTTSGAQGITQVTQACAAISDKFNVSLDTLSRKTYSSLRGVDRLPQTLEVIRETVRIRQKTGLNSVKLMTAVTPETVSELSALLRFAVDECAELYLNPVFSYFEGQMTTVDSPGDIAAQLEHYAFHRNSVIMLHFLEFYRDASENASRPLCSANRQTLTVAANGSLILPCYHARQRRFVFPGEQLKEFLHSEKILPFRGGCLSQCRTCSVTPYFGISFSFRLDKFFLLASFSEKLVHMKRDFLNEFDLDFHETDLMEQLHEFKCIVRSLNADPPPENGALYWAKATSHGYMAPVYRRTVSSAQYEKDLTAIDCWELDNVPHRLFDRMSQECLPFLANWLRAEPDNLELKAVLSLSQEWMLRWWKYYVSDWFQVSVRCDIDREVHWLERYFRRIRRCFSEHNCLEPDFPTLTTVL